MATMSQAGIPLPLPTSGASSTYGASLAASPQPPSSDAATPSSTPKPPATKKRRTSKAEGGPSSKKAKGSTSVATPGERERSAGAATPAPSGPWAGSNRAPSALGPPRAGTAGAGGEGGSGNWATNALGATANAPLATTTTAAAAATTTTTTTGGTRGRKPYTHQGQFTKDIARLMYAFGDVETPNAASVSLLEEMTVDFITDLCLRARPSPYSVPVNVHPSPHVPSTFAADGTFQLSEAAEHDDGDVTNLMPSGGPSSSSTSVPYNVSSSDDMPSLLQPKLPHPFATRAKVKMEDFKLALRKDAKKLARLEELLYLDKVISEARRGFEVPTNEDDVGGIGGGGGGGGGGASATAGAVSASGTSGGAQASSG